MLNPLLRKLYGYSSFSNYGRYSRRDF